MECPLKGIQCDHPNIVALYQSHITGQNLFTKNRSSMLYEISTFDLLSSSNGTTSDEPDTDEEQQYSGILLAHATSIR